jgi:hypothetical protein
MKNKRGDSILFDNAIYIILLVLFVAGMSIFIYSNNNGGAVLEDYYSKEVSKIVDFSNGNQEVLLDVHSATESAIDNGIRSLGEVFVFDNENKRVGVKLSPGGRTYYSYFSDFSIVECKIRIGVPGNVLFFKITDEDVNFEERCEIEE